MSNKLFVGNLPWRMSNEEFAAIFSPYGDVVDAFIVTEKETGRSKGFGFIQFADSVDAASVSTAIEATNGKEVGQGDFKRPLNVTIARPKEEGSRPARPRY
jgi:RNA recognition motif-containing protein